jgi:hypothetical protein
MLFFYKKTSFSSKMLSFIFELFQNQQFFMKLASFQYKWMILLPTMLSLISMTACHPDKAKPEQLRGVWNLTTATRNGQDAASLEKVFYNFTKDSVRTNFTITQTEEQGSFKVQKDKLIQNTTPPIQYKIVHFDETSMELTTELKGFQFKLMLQKAPKTNL